MVEEEKDLQFRAFTLKNIAVTDAERIIRDLLGLPKGVQNVSAAATMTQPGFMGRFAGRFPFGGAFGSRFSSRFADRLRSREASRSAPSRRPTPSAASSQPLPNVSLAVDERTNTLLVSAPPTQMKIVEQAIQTVDVADAGQGARFAAKPNEPYLEVYTTEHADASEVAKTLSVLYPGTVVNEDRRYGRIHIFATAREQREIAALIRRLDGATSGTTVAVIPTGPMDTAMLTTTLQALFGSDPENSPSIVANPGQLVVRGTPEQVAQVRSLLDQMGAGSGAGRFGTGRVRRIPLGSRDPMQFLRLLQSVSPYPIRVRAAPGKGPIQDERVPAATGPVVPRVEPSPEPRRSDLSQPQGPTSLRERDRPHAPPPGRNETVPASRQSPPASRPDAPPGTSRGFSKPTAARGTSRSNPLRVILAAQRREPPPTDRRDQQGAKRAQTPANPDDQQPEGHDAADTPP
ncbi:MAG TPA: hypothetical protein EYP14_00435, partial [Planctomycetaceae bacterium]|nr:hypothetical protein [Planctomycetaceae bacterium]